MVLEDMIVRGLRATEKMTWLDAYYWVASRNRLYMAKQSAIEQLNTTAMGSKQPVGRVKDRWASVRAG